MLPVAADGSFRTIFVFEGLIHTDILVPADADVRARFAALRDGPIPLDHPNLRWLSFGWGARAFYTTAGTYAEIEPAAVWRAATGDAGVMRVVALPEIVAPHALRVTFTANGFDRLLAFIDASFRRDAAGRLRAVPASLEPNAAFNGATGRFHLFNPCNEWTRRALQAAGVAAGRWTPKTQALMLGLRRHGGLMVQMGGIQP